MLTAELDMCVCNNKIAVIAKPSPKWRHLISLESLTTQETMEELGLGFVWLFISLHFLNFSLHRCKQPCEIEGQKLSTAAEHNKLACRVLSENMPKHRASPGLLD